MAGVFSRARLWLILVLFAAATLPAAAQSARPKDKLHFGAIDYTFYLLPVETAQRQGFFAEESLDVDVTFIPAGKGPGEALLKNDINIAIASVEAMLQSVESGSPLRIVGSISGKLSHYLVTRKPFTKIEDLKGATVGILNMREGSFFWWQGMAAKHGLNFPADYKVYETSGAAARHKLLLDGTIDAGLQSIPWNYVAEDAGLNSLDRASDYVPDYLFTSYIVNNDWAKAHPDLVARFLRAILKANDWIYRNRSAASEIAARDIMKIKPAYAERAWDYFTGTGALTRDLTVGEAGLKAVFDVKMKAGGMPAGLAFDAARYVDASYLARAKAGGTPR